MVGRGNDKSSLKDRLTTAVPELTDADQAVLYRLLENAQIVKLDHDRFVFHAGDLCQALLILLDGEARVQLTSESGPETPWGWIGIVPLVTGLVGNCPVYSLLGIRTCPIRR